MKREFEARYGTRRGFILTKAHSLACGLGVYRDKEVDWDRVKRLVFVCKGNVCRSAFGEYVAKSLGANSISGGICAVVGATANARAIEVADKLGFDLKPHRTTPIMYPVLAESDLLISMEPWQATFLSKHLTSPAQSTLLGLWATPRRPYVHDPYGHSQEYFERCFHFIEKSVNGIISRLK